MFIMKHSLADVLAEVDAKFRIRCCSSLRQKFPGLGSEDLADAWGEALASLYSKLSHNGTESYLESDVSLRKTVCEVEPLIWTISFRRAVDRLRQQTKYVNALAEAAEEIKISLTVSREDELRDLIRRVREETERLPEMQRIVMHELIRGYPETEKMTVLRDAVIKVTGKQDTTVGAVKRSLNEARKKLRELLVENGD